MPSKEETAKFGLKWKKRDQGQVEDFDLSVNNRKTVSRLSQMPYSAKSQEIFRVRSLDALDLGSDF